MGTSDRVKAKGGIMNHYRRPSLSTVLCALTAAALLPTTALAGQNIVRDQVSWATPDLPEHSVRIDDTTLVWTAETTTQRGKELYWVDFAQNMAPENLSNDVEHPDYAQFDPAISGDRIVYSEQPNTGTSGITLRYFDLATGEDHDISRGDFAHDSPDIDGDRVVWSGHPGTHTGDIRMLQFDEGIPGARLDITTSGTVDDEHPRVSGDRVVWMCNRVAGNDVGLYDITTGETTFARLEGMPAGLVEMADISGDRVAMQFTPAGQSDSDIMIWDLSKGTFEVLQNDGDHQHNPAIDGDRVYWVGYEGDGIIGGINLASGTTMRADASSVEVPTFGSAPAVSGETVAWADARNGRIDIWRRTRYLSADRLAGNDRYDAAVAIAREEFGAFLSPTHWDPMTHVIIASGEDKAAADPLSASGLCWTYSAPLLLTSSTKLPSSTKTALQQMHADNPGLKIVVVGGPASVPSAVVAEMEAIVGTGDVERLLSTGGRYEMAAAVSTRMRSARPNEIGPAVLYANGADPATFFDALSLSAVSRSAGIPILLVSADAVPTATKNESSLLAWRANENGYDLRRYIGGGPKTVSESVRVQLGVSAQSRWYGADRYATSLSIAENATHLGYASPGRVALAAKVPDALAGGAFAGADHGLLIVTNGTVLPSSVRNHLRANHTSMDRAYLLGGTASVTPAVATNVDAALQY